MIANSQAPFPIRLKRVLALLLIFVALYMGLMAVGVVLMRRAIADAKMRTTRFYQARQGGNWDVPDTRFATTMKKELAAHEEINGLPTRFEIKHAFAQILGRPAHCEVDVVRGGQKFRETLSFNGDYCFHFSSSELKAGLADVN